MKSIYLDYAATTPTHSLVLSAFKRAVIKYPGNPNSAHALGQKAAEGIAKSLKRIRHLLGLPSHYELTPTSGATESNNLALKGIALRHGTLGKTIITTAFEHTSITASANYLAKHNKQDVVIKGNNSVIYESGDEIFLNFDLNQSHLFDIESSQAILGVPRENRLDMYIKDGEITLANKVIKMSDNFKSRILWDTLDGKKLSLSFSPKSVHFQEKENDIAFHVKVAFIENKTDSNTVFTKMKGYDKYIVFSLPKKVSVAINDEMTFYINEEKLYISDEHFNRLISHETVYPNLVSGEVKVSKGLTYFHFGKNKILAPELEGLSGKQDIVISQNLVSPIFSKKYYRKNKLTTPEMNKNRAIEVSAYDEDLLGNYNAVFVALSGMDTYATFFVDNGHSVYKCPRFHLELLPGALKKAD